MKPILAFLWRSTTRVWWVEATKCYWSWKTLSKTNMTCKERNNKGTRYICG